MWDASRCRCAGIQNHLDPHGDSGRVPHAPNRSEAPGVYYEYRRRMPQCCYSRGCPRPTEGGRFFLGRRYIASDRCEVRVPPEGPTGATLFAWRRALSLPRRIAKRWSEITDPVHRFGGADNTMFLRCRKNKARDSSENLLSAPKRIP